MEKQIPLSVVLDCISHEHSLQHEIERHLPSCADMCSAVHIVLDHIQEYILTYAQFETVKTAQGQ